VQAVFDEQALLHFDGIICYTTNDVFVEYLESCSKAASVTWENDK